TFGIPRVALGYASSPTNGSVTMRGLPLVVRVGFTPPPAPTPLPPPPPTHLVEYARASLVGIFALLAVVGWLLVLRNRRAVVVPRQVEPSPPGEGGEPAGTGETDAVSDYNEPPT
ncbi:MAG: hypothetical protein L3K13_07505, partial [Thermoplasmata archaeon]|nr:hypothetical protein [Thermoplasmata archaeon]